MMKGGQALMKVRMFRPGFSIILRNMFYKQCDGSPSNALNCYDLKYVLVPRKCSLRNERFLSTKPYLIDSSPIKWTQEAFIQIHDFTGLPWWSTIICTVVGFRLLITFPLAIYQSYILAKFENLHPEISTLAKELSKEMPIAIQKFKLDEKSASILFKRNLKKHTTKLIIRENCHPAKGVISLYIQLPIWFCLSLSLRNISLLYNSENVNIQKAHSELMTEGILWFSDLTVIDSSFALPILFGLINFTTLEAHALFKLSIPTRLQKWTKNVMRCVIIILVPVAATMPCSVCLYWVTSSSFGLIQNVLLQYPKVKRFFGIPKTPTECDAPLKNLYKNLKIKLNFLRRE